MKMKVRYEHMFVYVCYYYDGVNVTVSSIVMTVSYWCEYCESVLMIHIVSSCMDSVCLLIVPHVHLHKRGAQLFVIGIHVFYETGRVHIIIGCGGRFQAVILSTRRLHQHEH